MPLVDGLSLNPRPDTSSAAVPITEQRYSYSPLDAEQSEIRLSDLQPGLPNDPISASLRHVTLSKDSVVVYEAISYCWGDDATTSYLMVDQTPLAVPDSAYLALKAVRFQEKVRTVWIDAVCINQPNNVERGQQVAIMDQIYSLGTRNLISLGEDGGHAESVVAALDYVDKDIRRRTADYTNFLSFVKPNGEKQVIGLGPELTYANPTWKVIVKMLSLPWFSRVWVVQEAALARSNACIYGAHQINLKHLLRVAIWISRQGSNISWTGSDREALTKAAFLFDVVDRAYGRIPHVYVGQKIGDRTTITYELLDTLSAFDVTDSRDRIYGMLGLWRYCTGGNVPLAVQPDYAKSVAEVFTEAVLMVIRECRQLDLLGMVHQGSKQIRLELQLPSWVPLWKSPDYLEASLSLSFGFSADDGRHVRSIDENDVRLGTIQLQGFLVATVRQCEQACDFDDDWAKLLRERVCDFEYGYLKRSRSELVGLDAQPNLCHLYGKVAVYTTLLADCSRTGNGEHGATTAEDLEWFGSVVEYMGMKQMEKALKELFPQSGMIGVVPYGEVCPEVRRVAQSSWNACGGRRFCHLSNDSIGLGPRDMQEDDIVVVLYGGRWPFVLRKIEGDEGSYHFIGPAYVHGIMYGEAMRKHKESGEPDQTFCLK